MSGRKTSPSRRALWYLVVAGILLVAGVSFAFVPRGTQISYEHYEVTQDSVRENRLWGRPSIPIVQSNFAFLGWDTSKPGLSECRR